MRNSRSGLFAPFVAFALLVAPAINAGAQRSDSLPDFFRDIHSGRVRVVDLTHPLDGQSPYWPEGASHSPFHASSAATFEHDGYFARSLTMPEHFGTHTDAPAHFEPNGLTVDRIPVENFLTAALVVDLSEAAKPNPDYRVRAEDLENWAKAHGPMPPQCVVFIRNGVGLPLAFPKELHEPGRAGRVAFSGIITGGCTLPARSRASGSDRD